MRVARAVRLLLTAAMSLWLVSVQAATSGKIRVNVMDAAGAELGQAHLLFHSDPAGTGNSHPDVIATADAHGHFEVELAPGFYDVCVMSPSFEARCKKLLVKGARPLSTTSS